MTHDPPDLTCKMDGNHMTVGCQSQKAPFAIGNQKL